MRRQRRTQQQQPPQSPGWSTRNISINATKASLSPSLELTEALNCSLDTSFCDGSTRTGDSFVLQIDWPGVDINQLDESLSDPFLSPKFRKPRFQEAPRASSAAAQQALRQHQRPYSDDAPSLLHSSESSENSGNSPNHLPRDVPCQLIPSSPRLRFERDQASIADATESSLVVPHNPKAEAECHLWNTKLTTLLSTHGRDSLQVAECFTKLGHAQLSACDYLEAIISFQSSLRIYRKRKKPVAMATALDGLGMAKSRSGDGRKETMEQAIGFLNQAFELRHRELGVWHVDTVDTMNHLGTAYRLAHNLEEARRCYWEVFWVRKAIFGAAHPSVAVSAHELARSFAKLGSTEDAANFYQIALEIYDKMELSNENPAMARLLRDMKGLERVERWSGV